MSANSRFCLRIVLVCLYITPSHYHHCANFIWRNWTYKMPVRYYLSSVWVRLSIFSQLSVIHYTICGAVCFEFTNFLCDDWDNIYILCLIIIIKSEVYIGFVHETVVCAECLSIFFWITHELVNAINEYMKICTHIEVVRCTHCVHLVSTVGNKINLHPRITLLELPKPLLQHNQLLHCVLHLWGLILANSVIAWVWCHYVDKFHC